MISQCNHFRIRDDNEYGFDVENYIKSVEKEFKMDIRKHPQWKQIVQRLHVATTDCKRKKLASDFRKKYIIDNIYMQGTRLSPFQLTDMMARTCKRWQAMEANIRKPKVPSLPDTANSIPEYSDIPGEVDYKSTAHPNTEVMATISAVVTETLTEPRVQIDVELESDLEVSHLPIFLRVNQHKLLSPLGTEASGLSYATKLSESEQKSESEYKEWLTLKQSSMVRCIPDKIKIINNILKEQSIKFSIINCTTEYLNLRYKYVTDMIHFKCARVFPVTPLKLYPGLRVTFKFIFKLLPNETAEDFVSSLYFKVGPNILAGSPTEAYIIPIFTHFSPEPYFTVTETVVFTPAYSWHINENCGHPTGIVKMSVNDGKHYNIRVIKRLVNYIAEAVTSVSDVAIAPNTESLMERTNSYEPDFLNTEFSGDQSLQIGEEESVDTINVIDLIVQEIIDLSLDTFVFAHTFIDLYPQSKNVYVYFTKPEHIGYHQTYYDFNLCEPETGIVLETKSVLLLAEVLPHPIQFLPELLDMSDSPIIHGFCEDHVTITNTHKVYNVKVKFMLTTKMRKLFHISPVEVFIDPQAKANFTVRMCSREFKSIKFNNRPDELVHFTIKIIFSGHKAVYHNVPPLFYEIIAPCASEFKKTYNEKYYKEEISPKNSVIVSESVYKQS